MKPLRKYQAKLDDDTKASIFRIHNVLAQYYPDASEAAVDNFRRRKAEFYGCMTIDREHPMDVWNEEILGSPEVKELLNCKKIEIVGDLPQEADKA